MSCDRSGLNWLFILALSSKISLDYIVPPAVEYVNNILQYFIHISVYPFTHYGAMLLHSQSCKPIFYSASLRPGTAPFLTLHCTLALSVPFQKKPPSDSFFFHYTSFTQPYSGFVTPLTLLGWIYNYFQLNLQCIFNYISLLLQHR